MIRFWLVFALVLTACQSAREKDALLIKDRVEKLKPLSVWKPMRCQVRTQLSASQAVKYRNAFPDERELIENWNVVYEWTPRASRCEVHTKQLSPVTANQRAFLDEAFCTLLEVFWVHSPFDGLRILPTDVVDQDTRVFIQQRDDSDLGIYLDKADFRLETKTAKKGTLSALYQPVDGHWLPVEIRHKTSSFEVVLKDFVWNDDLRSPPKSFWISVGEQDVLEHKDPVAHTGVEVSDCVAW